MRSRLTIFLQKEATTRLIFETSSVRRQLPHPAVGMATITDIRFAKPAAGMFGNTIRASISSTIPRWMTTSNQSPQHPTQRSEGTIAERHASVLLAKSPEELEQAYDEWADDYTNDLGVISGLGTDRWGRSAYKVMIEDLQLTTPQSHPRLLDFACGPGMAGPWFQQKGWGKVPGSELHGNDLSQKMLDVTARLHPNVYTKLFKSSFDSSGVPYDYYDAIHCSGMFAPGQAPPSAFDEFLNVLQTGGLVAFTIRTTYYDGDEGADHKAYLEELCRQGKWEVISQTKEEYLPKEDLYCYVFVMKKL